MFHIIWLWASVIYSRFHLYGYCLLHILTPFPFPPFCPFPLSFNKFAHAWRMRRKRLTLGPEYKRAATARYSRGKCIRTFAVNVYTRISTAFTFTMNASCLPRHAVETTMRHIYGECEHMYSDSTEWLFLINRRTITSKMILQCNFKRKRTGPL